MRIYPFQTSLKYQATIIKFLLVIMSFVFFAFPFSIEASGSLTSVKDTLSNDRPSVATTVTGAITAGDTTITLASTLGFAPGDSVVLKEGATTETRVIAGVTSLTKLAITAGTTNSYTTSAFAYLKQTAKHTITFTTRSAVSGGKFIVYIPADASPNDQTPAANGYDFNLITNSTTTDITLSGFTATSVATSTASSNLIWTIPFSGTVATNTAISIAIGTTNKLLSPTKTAAQGTADTYTVEVDETDGSSNVIDTTSVKVGTIESVGVSATVTPSLTFTINAVGASTSVAGVNTDVATTATTAPFSTLTAITNRTVAQYIHIDTNSDSGYIVTAQSDGQLRKTNGTVIPDFNLTAADNNAVNGFGYSLQNKANSTASFLYNDSGTFFSKGFNSSTPVTIMSNGSAASGDEVYVAYRVRISATQAAGTYQNLITYIATATY